MNKEEENYRFDLIDHPSLKILMPHVKSYSHKGLKQMQLGKDTFTATTAEIYASNVLERVMELDNALASLRITWDFVTELSNQPSPSPDIYRYYYENFVLRVIGFVDRAHRLVGTALEINKTKLEGIKGNSLVENFVKTQHLDLHDALASVADAVHSYRGPRNELIHNTAFTSRELNIFQTFHHFGFDTDGINVDELARQHYSEGSVEIGLTIRHLVEALTNLLNFLQLTFMRKLQSCGATAP